MIDKMTCQHDRASPTFDEDAARDLSAREVRKRWPRWSYCPLCGTRITLYASYAHYIAGDW